MKTIESETQGPQAFIDGVRAALEGREISKIASFRVSATEIAVIFSKLGTTELVYDVKPKGSGFVASLKSEKVAFTHRAFRADIEGKLRKVMEKCGAKVAS
ncbi:MAG: hypothetical protein IOD12_15340 [Silvanigrellales bacterium]|jgi:hypothetical protein|nr:hypothetical protein [Silvanigrellales bacterium]